MNSDAAAMPSDARSMIHMIWKMAVSWHTAPSPLVASSAIFRAMSKLVSMACIIRSARIFRPLLLPGSLVSFVHHGF